jgi:hypothetical protein
MTPKPKQATRARVVPLPPAADTVPVPQIGRIVGMSANGVPQVQCDGAEDPVAARVFANLDTAALNAAAKRRAEVFLFFDHEDRRRPIIAGVLAPQQRPLLQSVEAVAGTIPEFARVDGKRIAIDGRDEIVLRCGEASITLRRNGRVVISGTFVESRSAGVQRIKGAAVKVN